MQPKTPSLGVLYEHPEWFGPLFAEFDRRRISYDRILATALRFDPAARGGPHAGQPYTLVINRMSPSAYVRGHGHAIFASLSYLRHLEIQGVPVVNGADVFALELSKTAQISLLARLGLPHPRTVVINNPAQAMTAAEALTFPILVKPNIGGSGARIQRYETPDDLLAAVAAGRLDLGIDQVALLQEFHPPAGDFIVRVEVLDGRFLYAIKVFPNPDAGFNLCPADICQDPAELDLCPVDLPKTNVRVEGTMPPEPVTLEVLRLARAARLDLGGIEYLISERDGRRYYYDINALSNFVTDAPRIVGFDPVPVFVDYLERRAAIATDTRRVVGRSRREPRDPRKRKEMLA